ncbi:uncharacterized protein LOC131875497 isoform X2 [Cryptomeria japonica]|uniref:uncharacterized protein LOC131875497 isoform X2 n=1 Tax=Cryptomeria japonica TaxID=3369 RepID=UPI0027DA190D|nr:uncharacterized protein LOC131875497 isoform X2 [Cryptomeria japonica]
MASEQPKRQENDPKEINPFQVQEEAKEAAKEAFAAQQQAEEVIKQAYANQVEAREKTQRAAQQVLAQQESGKQAATVAAREATAAIVEEQKAAAQKQIDQTALTAQMLGAQTAQQSMASSQMAANKGFSQGNVPSFQQPTDQQELLGLANQMASAAATRMYTAHTLASTTQDPQALMAAKSQADVAQNQMAEAQRISQAAQTPATAMQALASIRQSSLQTNQQLLSGTGSQSTETMQM